MIVISDGDLIKNQLDKNFQPIELGYDQRSEICMITKISNQLPLLDDTDLLTFEVKILICLY
jgi:hypothetical protein